VASFIIHDRMGASHYEVDDDAIDRVLGELDDPVDDRHPVSIEHVSGWVLSAFQSGLVVWENAEEDGEPRHMRAVSRDRVRELFRHVAAGDLDPAEAELWQPGYG
jgi:hypothetical protein